MRILTIEDDPRVAGFLAKGLRAEGYQVESALRGEEGAEIAKSEAFSLLLVDVALPDTNGIELCQHLREVGLKVPILMLTAKSKVRDKVRGLEAGADDYVTKPFSFEELLARIKALVRRHNGIDACPVLQVADLVLNSATHEAMRDSRPIALTFTEFTLLSYLMESTDRVLSRTMIEQHVWGYQDEPQTNVVDVYIRRLRKKIDENFSPSLIRTVRGVGYQLRMPASEYQ